MTPLRKRMIDDMTLVGLAPRTQDAYIRAVRGLAGHYRSDKDGAERLENLEELITAAESFVTQEGFGRDAVALPLDAS